MARPERFAPQRRGFGLRWPDIHRSVSAIALCAAGIVIASSNNDSITKVKAMTTSATSRVERELYMPLRQALRLLPNIRPMLAREQLGRALFQARRAQDRTARVAAIDVRLQEFEELFIQDGQGLPRVSPTGAALLLRLHAGGVFEFCDRARGTSAPVELERYAHSLPALLQRQAQMEETKRIVDDMVEHPERVCPEQFSYEILDRIFHRHKGRGPATFEVGGSEITKHCLFMVNTKKETSVRFTWRDSAGNDKELTRSDVLSRSRRENSILTMGPVHL